MTFRLLVLAGAALIARRIIKENRSEPAVLLPSPARAGSASRARKSTGR